MKVTAEWWVQRCLAAADAAAKEAALTPDDAERTGMPVFDKNGNCDTDRASKWFAWAMSGGKGSQTVQEAASAAFQREMPPLVSRGHTKAFIACVASGFGHKYLTAGEVKSLMYSAQLALSAFRPRARQPQTPTPSPSGFDKTTPAAEALRAQNRGGR